MYIKFAALVFDVVESLKEYVESERTLSGFLIAW